MGDLKFRLRVDKIDGLPSLFRDVGKDVGANMSLVTGEERLTYDVTVVNAPEGYIDRLRQRVSGYATVLEK